MPVPGQRPHSLFAFTDCSPAASSTAPCAYITYAVLGLAYSEAQTFLQEGNVARVPIAPVL